MKTLRIAARLLGTVAGLMMVAGVAAQAQQGVTKDEILLGTILDLSGPAAFIGKQARYGLQMRIDEANAAGGVNGRKIRLLVEDSGYDPKRAVLAAQKLVNSDKVFTIVSILGTAPAEAVMPILFENNMINFMPLSGARAMFDPPHRLKVAIIPPYYPQIEAAVNFAVTLNKHSKVCIIYQDDDSGLEHVLGTETALKALGMGLTERASYKRGSTDFSSQVARMKGAGCTLIALGAPVRETVAIMSEARKTDYKAEFAGSSNQYYQTLIQLGGSTVEGIYASSGITSPSADSTSKGVRDWFAAYKAKFNEDPEAISAWDYVMMDLFIAGATKAGPNLTTDSLLNVMETTTFPANMFGVGEFRISKTNRLGNKESRIYQLQNGKWVTLR